MISVLIASYNNSATILQCLYSVIQNLTTNDEIIVVDDGSTDSTKEILVRVQSHLLSKGGPSFVIVNNPTNMGLPASLNKGFNFCSGEYIARMDADDICLTGRFKLQKDILDQYPNLDLISNKCIPFSRTSQVSYLSRIFENQTDCNVPKLRYLSRSMISKRNLVCHPAVMGRNSFFRHNSYSLKYPKSQDYECWLRAIFNGYTIAVCDIPVLMYRCQPLKQTIILQLCYAIKARCSILFKNNFISTPDLLQGIFIDLSSLLNQIMRGR